MHPDEWIYGNPCLWEDQSILDEFIEWNRSFEIFRDIYNDLNHVFVNNTPALLHKTMTVKAMFDNMRSPNQPS